MSKPYPDETVELVARAEYESHHVNDRLRTDWVKVPSSVQAGYRDRARAGLAALAAAGLLVDPDGKLEWGTTDPDFPELVMSTEDNEARARHRAKIWPHVKLLRRGQGSWVEVPIDGA